MEYKVVNMNMKKCADIKKRFQQTFTCSISTIGTLEKGVKYVQNKQWRHRNNVNEVVMVSLLLILNRFHTFFCFFFFWLRACICLLGYDLLSLKRSSGFYMITASVMTQLRPYRHLRWISFANIVSSYKLTIFIKTFYSRCLMES